MPSFLLVRSIPLHFSRAAFLLPLEMATAILRSHDCLRHDTFSLRNSNPNPNPNASNQTRRRKRSPVAVQANFHDRDRSRCGDRSVVVKGPVSNLVMGQVKILKRGEKLSPDNSHRGHAASAENREARAKSLEGFDLVLGSTNRLGPDPDTMQKQIRVSDLKDGIYAGSAFVASPPPSSVPVPGFLGKNGAATSDLRRLLRLDLV